MGCGRMRIVLAPNALTDSRSAIAAADAMAEGLFAADPGIDVANPLTGTRGAARVFAPQRGAEVILKEIGIDALFSLCPRAVGLAEAQAQVRALLAAATEQVLRAFLIGHRAERGDRSPNDPTPTLGPSVG